MTTAAIILAAGRGTRAGGDLPKQWQALAGRPVVAHALAAFAGMPRILVIHPDDRARAAAVAEGVQLVEGGTTRDASVRNALEALAGQGRPSRRQDRVRAAQRLQQEEGGGGLLGRGLQQRHVLQ